MIFRTFLLLSFGSLIACSSEDAPETGVVVVVEADPALRSRITAVTVRVEGGTSQSSLSLSLEQEINPNGLWPLRTVLAPENGIATRIYRYEATAFAGTTSIGRVRVIDRYTEGLVPEILLRFVAACEAVHDSCEQDETCENGSCVDASRLNEPGPDAGPGDAAVDSLVVDASSDVSAPGDVGEPDASDFCGDGVPNGAEECDDGNAGRGDGCSPECFVETIDCNDLCALAMNGVCEDSRPSGMDPPGCALGADCADCGPAECGSVVGSVVCAADERCIDNLCVGENTNALCSDRIDNDMNAMSDCRDSVCLTSPNVTVCP